MTAGRKVGILISGRGSNMISLAKACQEPAFPAEISAVVSNRADAAGLEAAAEMGLATEVVDHKRFGDRSAFEERLDAVLRDHGTEILCSAGFLRLLTGNFVHKWFNRHLNIHPSLLPAFKGLNTHERVIDEGVRISGCTVHFVRTAMDSGPIIAQAAVNVLTGDSAESLAARVLAAEHRLYPGALELVASGRARVIGDKVVLQCDEQAAEALFSP